MTVQTKQFIDLSDVLSVRFTCRNCDTSLSMPIADDKLKKSDRVNNFIDNCPSCGRPWVNMGGSNSEQLVTRFTTALNLLKETLYREPPTPIGFTFSIEVTKLPEY